MSQADIRQDITNRVIAALESGVMPWRRPWSLDPNSGLAANVVSKKGYRGVNTWMLEITAMVRGYTSKYWGTYNQWKNLGGQVKKRPDGIDFWGTTVILWNPIEKKGGKIVKHRDGTTSPEKIMLMRTYTVFNVDQVEGADVDQFRVQTIDESEPIEVEPDFTLALAICENTEARVVHSGSRAFYDRVADKITLPLKKRFADPAAYFTTRFHELAHWAESRLDWKGDYAEGELIAEMASCMLASAAGIPVVDMSNHVDYIAHWLKALKQDSSFILRVSSQASKVVDYILKFSNSESSDASDVEVEMSAA